MDLELLEFMLIRSNISFWGKAFILNIGSRYARDYIPKLRVSEEEPDRPGLGSSRSGCHYPYRLSTTPRYVTLVEVVLRLANPSWHTLNTSETATIGIPILLARRRAFTPVTNNHRTV